jgi:N-6 DNA Methylase
METSSRPKANKLGLHGAPAATQGRNLNRPYNPAEKIDDAETKIRNNGIMKIKSIGGGGIPEPGALFSYLKRNKEKLLTHYDGPSSFCRALIEDASDTPIPESAQDFLRQAQVDERHYAIASAYAVLIGDDRRRELSAYFTPPVLVKAAIEASSPFIEAKEHPAILDPACGGGSFLTPVARHLIIEKRRRGMPVL